MLRKSAKGSENTLIKLSRFSLALFDSLGPVENVGTRSGSR